MYHERVHCFAWSLYILSVYIMKLLIHICLFTLHVFFAEFTIVYIGL